MIIRVSFDEYLEAVEDLVEHLGDYGWVVALVLPKGAGGEEVVEANIEVMPRERALFIIDDGNTIAYSCDDPGDVPEFIEYLRGEWGGATGLREYLYSLLEGDGRWRDHLLLAYGVEADEVEIEVV